MYAVVAPGLRGIYEDPAVIDRILALYPYVKFRKFETEQECWEFLARYENRRGIDEITNFGDTFDKHHVVMEYFIKCDTLYYNFDTRNLGTLRLRSDNALIQNRTHLITAMLPSVRVDPSTISGHVVAIYNGIKLLGDYIDVEVLVPDHSIFYAIHSYSGQNRTIARLRSYMSERVGKVSITLRR